MNDPKPIKNHPFFRPGEIKRFAAALAAALVLHASVIFVFIFLKEGGKPEPGTAVMVELFPHLSGGKTASVPHRNPETPAKPVAGQVNVPEVSGQNPVETSAKESADKIVKPLKAIRQKEQRPDAKSKPGNKPNKPSRMTARAQSENAGSDNGSNPTTEMDGKKGKGGVGGSAGQGSPDALNAYYAQILKRLEQNRKYPYAARKRGQEGVVTVSFTLDRRGRILSQRLVKSSDHRLLDEEILDLLKRVSLPPIPDEIPQEQLTITLPVHFRLERSGR